MQPAIASGYWYSNKGDPFAAVNSATITETKKIKLDNSSVVIEISPSTLNVVEGENSIEVTGSTLLGAYFTNVPEGYEENYWASKSYSAGSWYVDVFSNAESRSEPLTLNLAIVTSDRTVSATVIFPAIT